jgi:hypothetical protein
MPADQPPPPRTFGALLAALDEGRLHSELTETLDEVAAELYRWAVNNGGKAKGEMSLKLSFEAASDNTIVIVGKVTHKTPPEPTGRTIVWLGSDSKLHLANPRQLKLGVREVPAPTRAAEAPAAAARAAE